MMKAKAGTLVKTTKARIGVPLGTVGLVVRVVEEPFPRIEVKPAFGGRTEERVPPWGVINTVAIVRHLSGTERRWLFCDLEVAND